MKSTQAQAGNAQFFLTINEYHKASQLANYQLYVVFEISTQAPKVWILPNPFHPEHPNVVMKPVLYQVAIRTATPDEKPLGFQVPNTNSVVSH